MPSPKIIRRGIRKGYIHPDDLRETLYFVLDEHNEVRGTNDPMEWARFFGDPDRRFIADESVNGVRVATIFEGVGMLFGSMVFGGPLNGVEQHYDTYAEAVSGHSQLVERVRVATNDQKP